MSDQNRDNGRAAQEALRLAALRQLAFEEPVSRLARIRKTTAKQLPGRQKIKDFSPLQLTEMHGLIFAPVQTAYGAYVASLCLSIGFVLEDFRLYSDLAFNSFSATTADTKNEGAAEKFADTRTQNVIALAQKLASKMNLPAGRKGWLELSLLGTIDWIGLEKTLAGNGDSIVKADGRDHKNGDEPDLLSGLPELIAMAREESSPLVASAGTGAVTSADLTVGSIDASALLAVAQRLVVKIREKFRPSLLVLVEGQSEVIVLPHFARLVGQPFESLGALVVGSGGAKQVARRYLTMKDVLNIPIVCVFDGDAGDSSILIEESLRDCDRLCCLEAGELEDCYSWEQLVKILGRQLAQTGQSLAGDAGKIPRLGPRKEALNQLFRSRGLGDFDKIAFARNTVSLARSSEDVPEDMSKVIGSVAQAVRRF